MMPRCTAADRRAAGRMFLSLPVLMLLLGLHPLAQGVEPTDKTAESSPHSPRVMTPEEVEASVRQHVEDFDAFTRDLLDSLSKSNQQQLERSRQLAEEHNARARERLDAQMQRAREHAEGMADRIAEQVARNLARRRDGPAEQGLSSGQIVTLLVSALVALVVSQIPFRRLVDRARHEIARVDASDTLTRWRTRSGAGSLLALAPLALVFVSPPSWYLQFNAAYPHLAIVNLVLAGGVCLLTAVVLLHIRGLCNQRLDDLAAQALFATIAAGGTPGQPYILYLRPFASTNAIKVLVTITYKHTLTVELEQALSDAARPIGRLIALGHSLEHVGAGRITSVDAEWQEAARRLIHHASLILLVPSSRPGTRWEIEHLLESGHIAKTVFVDVPNVRVVSSRFAQQLEWADVGALFAAAGYQWPDDDPKGAVVFFGASRIPQLIEPLRLGQLSEALDRIRALVDGAPVAAGSNPPRSASAP